MSEFDIVQLLKDYFLQGRQDYEANLNKTQLSNNNYRHLLVYCFKEYHNCIKDHKDKYKILEQQYDLLKFQQESPIDEYMLKYYKDQTETINQFWEQSKQKNQNQSKQIKELYNNIQQLQLDLRQKQFQLNEVSFANNEEILKKLSIKIEEDNQYRQQIQELNKLRDETIQKMQLIINRYEEYRQQNQNNNNAQDQEKFAENFQKTLNQVKNVKQYLEQYENKLESFKEELQQNLQSSNDQTKKIINDTLKKLDQNRIAFTLVRNLFDKIVVCLTDLKNQNEKLDQNNQKLSQELDNQEKQNDQSFKQFQELVTKLKKQLNEEQQKQKQCITKQGMQVLYNRKDLLVISDSYADLYLNNFDQIRDDIYDLASKSLKLIAQENFNIIGSPELISDIKSFINNIENQHPQNVDSMNQKWQRSVDLFEQIYGKLDKDGSINKYVKIIIDQISKILQDLIKYKNTIEEKQREIQSLEQVSQLVQ